MTIIELFPWLLAAFAAMESHSITHRLGIFGSRSALIAILTGIVAFFIPRAIFKLMTLIMDQKKTASHERKLRIALIIFIIDGIYFLAIHAQSETPLYSETLSVLFWLYFAVMIFIRRPNRWGLPYLLIFVSFVGLFAGTAPNILKTQRWRDAFANPNAVELLILSGIILGFTYNVHAIRYYRGVQSLSSKQSRDT
jgi:Ca2+/Na+ antiporter